MAAAAALRIDDRGQVHVEDEGSSEDPSVVVAKAIEVVGALVGKTLSPVSARAISRDGQFVGLVMVSERVASGVRLRSGTGHAATSRAAVIEAVVRAVVPDGEVLRAGAERWDAASGVVAVSMEREGNVVISRGTVDETRCHAALASTLPGPGRLALEVGPLAYRVICLPSASVAVTANAGTVALHDVDRWMALVEATAAPFAPPPPYEAGPRFDNGKPPLVVLAERALGGPVDGLRFLPAPVRTTRT